MEQNPFKKALTQRLFPTSLSSVEDIQKTYPARQLPPGAMVTRIAPSPTGFMHVGTLYTAIISERLAHQSQGVFFVRLEDTDKKREVEGANQLVIEALNTYDVRVDEGPTLDGGEKGSYGPYTQSARESIYKTFVKALYERGLAYPCFCTNEELEETRRIQELQKTRTGYYGAWAIWRNKSDEEITQALDAGKSFVMRLKSPGDFNHKKTINDVLLGDRELPENDQDIVILKSDGLPTYHFAHLIDDHFMGTTHVIRGDEWFSSLPTHIQLFEVMGWQPPQYGHLAPIQKLDEDKKRKLSKRKDPEASISFFEEQGYPKNSLIEYLLNLANSTFEDWRKANPDADNREFALSLEKLANSAGALFDFTKLNDISKERVSRLSAEEVYAQGLNWAKKCDTELAGWMEQKPELVKAILNIERGNIEKPRKDIAKWSDIRTEVTYFLDEVFTRPTTEELVTITNLPKEEMQRIVTAFLAGYKIEDAKEVWLEKIRTLCTELGYAESTKALKANPAKYKGSISDVTKLLRLLLVGRPQSPDLHAVMQVMGEERVKTRLSI